MRFPTMLNEDNKLIKSPSNFKEGPKLDFKHMNEDIGDLKAQLDKWIDINKRVRNTTSSDNKIKDILTRIETIYKSLQFNLTCLVCGGLSQKCSICIPCGHCFCSKCISGKSQCPNCSNKINQAFESKALSDISCKFMHNKKAMDAFKDEKP